MTSWTIFICGFLAGSLVASAIATLVLKRIRRLKPKVRLTGDQIERLKVIWAEAALRPQGVFRHHMQRLEREGRCRAQRKGGAR